MIFKIYTIYTDDNNKLLRKQKTKITDGVVGWVSALTPRPSSRHWFFLVTYVFHSCGTSYLQPSFYIQPSVLNIFPRQASSLRPRFFFEGGRWKNSPVGDQIWRCLTLSLVLVFQNTSLTIATTTRKQFSPSFIKESSGSIFIIDSNNRCTSVFDSNCSAWIHTSETLPTEYHWDLGFPQSTVTFSFY